MILIYRLRLLILLFLPIAAFNQEIDIYTCTWKGINLYGKVQIVESNPDIRVEVVSVWPDILVDTTDYTPSRCGEWKFVKDWPDFKIQFVNSGADIKISFNNTWPGVPDNAKPSQDKSINDYLCTFGGKPLHGKVKVVTSFADIKVKIVTSFPDLKVKKVENFADDCGEWQFVDTFPDFTIEYVESFEDIKIEFVESFPGLP
jgi:hypothetical protein